MTSPGRGSDFGPKSAVATDTAPVGDFAPALGRHPLREAGGYALAGAAIIAVHAGVAAWAMQSRPEPLAEAPFAESAVMIDMAPEPEAPIAEDSQMSEQRHDAPPPETEPIDAPEDLEAVETEDTPDPVEDAPPLEEIVEEVPELEPMEEPELPVIDTAEAVLPVKPEPRPERPRVVEKPEVARPAPPKKTPPREAVRQTAKAPAVSAAGSQRWHAKLMAHLERRKRYPAAARRQRQEGVPVVQFSIDPAGNVLSARLARSSGVPELDQAVMTMIQRASPVPAPPPGANLNITVPVRFNIR